MGRFSTLIRVATAAVAVLTGSLAGAPARAQDLLREIKIGGLYHDVPNLWSGFQLERRSVDVNVELLFGPHIALPVGVLRPAIGGSFNTQGATSRIYSDVRWEFEGATGFFVSLGIGAAIHDGKTGASDPEMKALGSRLLFHFPAEIGWRWDGRNSVSLYFEHISNGYTQDYNEGLDALGVRYGYRFGSN